MGKQFAQISDEYKEFIQKQKIFFVGTAVSEGRVNISPKGIDSFRVMNGTRVVWLNVTGSGNETATHVRENPRMTILFTAFEGSAKILRLYGNAVAVHKNDKQWDELYSLFEPNIGARQIFDVQIDLVQTSCGFATPLFEYLQERDEMGEWLERKGEEGVREYWLKRNQTSIDGNPTYIEEGNL